MGLTREEMARVFEVSETRVWQWEHGAVAAPFSGSDLLDVTEGEMEALERRRSGMGLRDFAKVCRGRSHTAQLRAERAARIVYNSPSLPKDTDLGVRGG